MVVSAAHRQHWQRRLQEEAEAIAQRRLLAEQQAQQAAAVLQARWPEIRAVWLFGSVLEPRFSLNSDLDLCVEGLPSVALLEAMELLDEALLRDAEPGQCLPIDLVRLEALPLHWQQRLRDQARQLV
jgi:predicted nucleotidyltransferase